MAMKGRMMSDFLDTQIDLQSEIFELEVNEFEHIAGGPEVDNDPGHD